MAHSSDHFRSPLKQVRGLGPSGEGTHHFWLQRMTALALIPLCIWFLYSLIAVLLAAEQTTVALWFHSPINALLMAIMVVALFLHARLGIQIIIEDYVHCECAKITMLIVNSALKILLCVASLAAIAHLHFTGI